MSDQYSVIIKCDNCEYESSINILKGILVKDALISHKCGDCSLVGFCKKIGR